MVLLGSLLAGFVIGTLQHYVAFGYWGGGFGKDTFVFSLFEGGIIGSIFALPTGLIAYYVVLQRHVTRRQIAIVVLGSLVGGLATGAVASWISAPITPILTISLAASVKYYQLVTSERETPYL
jgi:uncharacterized protein YejL (UPF0352 family)